MARTETKHSRRLIAIRLLGLFALGPALLIASAMATERAFGAVISFDNLAAPAPVGQGLTVNTQYSGQGVTFNDVDAFSYPSGFAHSPSVGVEPCVGIEFCQAPVRADFTTPQDYVRVWVGYDGPLAAPLPVRLTAFNAALNEVGSTTATLPANASATPIQTPLELDPPGATVTRIVVSKTSGFNNGLAVDDVEFSTTGPPPPCTATAAPTVTVDQPEAGSTVQNNQFILRGNVDGKGAPITSATVVAESATIRTATAYPSLIDADGGQFGPVNFNGLLSPGANLVRVTATNCLGTGASSIRRVDLSQIPSGTRFKQLGMIEMSQAIQEPNNSVPLVAAAATAHKRTFARVYLGLEGGASSISSVTGRLTASRPDGSLPGGPTSIDSSNAITVEAANSRDDARSDLATSLNFELPREWLTPGKLHLQLDRLEIEGAQSTLPCAGCENPFPGGGPAVKTFHEVPPVRVWLVNVPWRSSPGATPITPTQFDIDMLASWLRRAYPTAEVLDTQLTMPTEDRTPGVKGKRGLSCTEVNSALSKWVQTLPGEHPSTRFYGVVSDAGGNFMRGCAQIGGRFGSGPAGANGWPWDSDGAYTDWYGGHEIGHTYNRKHPGFCGESSDDGKFPYPNGRIGDFGADFQGLDSGDSTLGLPLQLNDWRNGWTDVMTYCNNQWISDYTYRGILKRLCSEEKPNCPNRSELTRAGGSPASVRSSAAPDLLRKKGGRRLAVNGSLALPSNKLSRTQLSVLGGLPISKRPRKSLYAIKLVGRSGRTLKRYPFEPKIESDLPPGEEAAAIDEVVPFDVAARRVEITRGPKVLRSARVSRHAPSVKLTAPKKKKLKKRVKVRWRARDADGGRLTYTLLYSHRGKNFIPVASGLRKRSYRVDLRRLPGGKKAKFRVIANDGVLTGSATSTRGLKVPAKSPSVSIATPRSGATFDAGQPVQMVAIVDDLQDPRLPAKKLVWRSSIQGKLGKGAAIAPRLDPGTHEVTLSATNSAGKKSAASITVRAAAVPPILNAILIAP